MIASRQIAFAKGGKKAYTAKDYVQDGLVAMWDGIENAGWGVHDDTATVWKDLVGEYDLSLGLAAMFEHNAIYANRGIAGDGYMAISDMRLPLAMSKTLEASFRADKVSDSADSLVVKVGVSDYDNNYQYFTRLISVGWGGKIDFSGGFKNVFGDGGITADEVNSGDVTTATGIYDGALTVSAYCNGTARDRTYIDTGIAGVGTRIGGQDRTSRLFNGRIHNIRIYSRALTADEIAHNYEIDKARFGL